MTRAEPHITTRLRERYGIEATQDDLCALAEGVWLSRWTGVPGRRRYRYRQLEVWELPLQGKLVLVLWDVEREALVTALPPDAIYRPQELRLRA